ncbi:MAG TPA: E2 ligase fold family C protein [Chthoniobacterales bacterium]|jgi:hypothetical protein|nr:E2 ligase fold family C protein [Chthoniobacterales bacterium]
MALANFFDKASLAAADVLREFDATAFAAALEAQTVGIAFDGRAAETAEGRVALELATDLFARLYPRLALLAHGAEAGRINASLVSRVLAINPQLEIFEKPDAVSAVLTVGSTNAPAGIPAVYVGSQGWITRVSSRQPVGCGDSHNPFGAAAAACIGAANIFRFLFRQQLPPNSGRFDEYRSFSLIDFQPEEVGAGDPPLNGISLGDTTLVGNGAIGNAVIWTLTRTPGAVGRLNIVDPETIELSNLQRYVLTTQESINASKASLGEDVIKGAGLAVQPFAGTWAGFLEKRQDWNLQNVLVAVDNVNDRRQIQGALPRWLANAWTQPGDLGVSRHEHFGESACLTCLYFPEGPVDSEDRIVANSLNLPGEFMAVRHLLYTGAPIGRDLILRIAQANGVDSTELLRFENEPLRIFYSKAVCGGMMIKLGSAAGPGRGREVPLAFQSALAGILLAAEVVVHANRLRVSELPTTTRIDLLRPLSPDLGVPVARKRNCICSDTEYTRTYNSKWAGAEAQRKNAAAEAS